MMDREPYYYPDYIKEALYRLGQASFSKQYPLLNKRVDLIHVLFNQFERYPITDQVYNYVWWLLNNMTKMGNVEWLIDYWSYAVQYCMLHFGSYSKDEEGKKKYLEFHLMMGVIMVHLRRFDVLRHMMSFTNALPAQFPLVPSTFSDIWLRYKDLSVKNEWELYLLKYRLIGMNAGAMEESKTEGVLLDYIALLLIRLNTVNDYNITYSDPMGLPPMGSTIEQIDADINVSEVIKQRIGKWRRDKSALKDLDYNSADVMNAMRLMESFQNECRIHQKRITHEASISEIKRTELKKGLINAVDSVNLMVPISPSSNGYYEITSIARQSVKLDERLILTGRDPISNNLAEAIVGALAYEIQHYFCYQFLLNNSANSFSVPYRDISKALERLSLDSSYSILAMGVSPFLFEEVKGFAKKGDSGYSYYGIDVIEIASDENSFIIMKKETCPSVSLRPLSENETEDGLVEIDSAHHLNSNVDYINQKDLVLKVSVGYQLNIPNSFRYVRLRVSYQLDSDSFVLGRIKPIKSYIV